MVREERLEGVGAGRFEGLTDWLLDAGHSFSTSYPLTIAP
jgi:hypothetical protein